MLLRKYFSRLLTKSIVPTYPHRTVTMSLAQFMQTYQQIQTGVLTADKLAVAGRIVNVRSQGKKMIFLDVQSDGFKTQVVVNDERTAEEVKKSDRGDYIHISGNPMRTKSGQLSILAQQITLIAPCNYMLPQKNTLIDPQIRQRQRYLDLMVNKSSLQNFKLRSRLIWQMRNFLVQNGFMQVQTPVLCSQASGASAPFKSKLDQLKAEVTLRISPQLQLKQLVIGGLQRIFQLGKSFRNQGIDSTHNPEFTMLQAYCAHWDYITMMKFTQDLLTKVSPTVNSTLAISAPFKKLDYLETLEAKCSQKIDFLGSQSSLHRLLSIFQRLRLPRPQITTQSHLLDKLSSALVQPTLTQPTFLVNHPLLLSPLARPKDSLKAQRFQLFIGGMEIANGYSQLNDPKMQSSNFNRQAALKGQDQESMAVDQDYLKALEYGLPACSGLGIGIDRLAMVLLDKKSIQQVLLFPFMRRL